MDEFRDNDLCFVCGRKNPDGLKLNFRINRKKNTVETEVTFQDHLQGWEGIVHGGIISTVLDEIMIKTTEARGLKCVTAEINTKLKKPALTGEKYSVQGKIRDIRGKIILCESEIKDSGNNIVAISTAKLFEVE